MENVVEAHRYVDTGRKKGNIVITMQKSYHTWQHQALAAKKQRAEQEDERDLQKIGNKVAYPHLCLRQEINPRIELDQEGIMVNSATIKTKPAFDLEIELVLVEDNAKRKICVGANITFERLHKIVQAAYNWHECHLYQFFLYRNGDEGEKPSIEIVGNKEEASNPKIAKLVHRAKLSDYFNEYKHIVYLYDFGDGWVHYIDVVGSTDNCDDNLPLLLDGENDAPPEDCGGPEGFADFLKIIGKPKHKEHNAMQDWAALQGWERFDLNAFSK